MGELGALFNPGMRHELEERRSKAMRREEEGNARDGDLRIDLESGVAVINVPGADSNSADHSRAAVQQDRAGAQDQAAEHDAVAEHDAAATTATAAAADSPAGPPADAAEAPAAPPAQPRPRGKRGLAASSR